MMAFIFATLTLVAVWTSTKKGRAPVLLNRQQTEEWKGWMQARLCPLSAPSVLPGKAEALPIVAAAKLAQCLCRSTSSRPPSEGPPAGTRPAP